MLFSRQDLFNAHFEEVCTAEQFRKASHLVIWQVFVCNALRVYLEVRTYMFDTGADLAGGTRLPCSGKRKQVLCPPQVFEDLLQAGFLSEDGMLTAGSPPSLRPGPCMRSSHHG